MPRPHRAEAKGQKLTGQLAGGGGILWRPPTQLVIFLVCGFVRYIIDWLFVCFSARPMVGLVDYLTE